MTHSDISHSVWNEGKCPFLKYTLLSLMYLNNFPSMCQNIFECAQLMNFITSTMEPKHMCFDVLDFQGQSLFQ